MFEQSDSSNRLENLLQNLGWFFSSLWKIPFLRSFILKPTERVQVLLKSYIGIFKIALRLGDRRRVTRGMMGGGLSCPFSKVGQKCPNFWKKCPDYGHLWAKFLILNAILKSFQEKKLEIFPCGAFVSRVVLYMDVYQGVLIPRKLPFPKNFLVTLLDRYVFM